MKRVWEIFKKYYLLDLIIYGGVLSILGFLVINENQLDYIHYLVYFGLFIPLTVLITGSFGFVKYEVLRPKKKANSLNSAPFTNFRNHGFKENNKELIGQINGYHVCAGIEWENYQKKPIYYFRVLFNPLSLNRHITFSEFIKFNEVISKNEFYINPNRIEKSYSNKELAKNHYRDIIIEIEKMIDFLKFKGLKSISHKEWRTSISTIEKIEDDYLSQA